MIPPTFHRDNASPNAGDADAREFEKFACDHHALDIDAALWAARVQSGLTTEQEAELHTWLQADPRHATALEGMRATFGQLRQLPADRIAAIRHGLHSDETDPHSPVGSAAADATSTREVPARTTPPGKGTSAQAAQWRSWRPRLTPLLAPAAVAVLMAAVVGAGGLGWDRWAHGPTFEQAFTTGHGQQIVATLPDDPTTGSTVHLDTATRLDARLFRNRREVHLAEGQALFSVHGDRERPFHVWAGQLQITVVGTRFSVRHTASGLDAGKTVVSVEEGHVRVSRAMPAASGSSAPSDTAAGSAPKTPVVPQPGANDGDSHVELVAGQMLVSDGRGRWGPVIAVPPTAMAAWRSGRVSFDNTPLSEALAEFERYRSTGLVIRDPAVAQLRVGGSYSVQQVRHFADTLPLVLPVRLVPQGDVTEIALRRP